MWINRFSLAIHCIELRYAFIFFDNRLTSSYNDYMSINQKILNTMKAVEEYVQRKEYVAQKARDPLIRLIAALPFIAGSSHPERLSIIHVNAYFLMSCDSEFRIVFNHDIIDNNDYFERLAPLNTFRDGNKKIIERGMSIILLVMLQDYIADTDNDKANNKYNPINNGVWNASEMRKNLIIKIRSIRCPEMEEIFPTDAVINRKYWLEEIQNAQCCI